MWKWIYQRLEKLDHKRLLLIYHISSIVVRIIATANLVVPTFFTYYFLVVLKDFNKSVYGILWMSISIVLFYITFKTGKEIDNDLR